MAKRGPKPKPTALKKLAGVRRDRISADEPIATPGLPEAPTHLDKLAIEEWNRLVPLLHEMGVLARIDGAALAIYCDCHSRWLRSRADLIKHGMLMRTKAGYKTNPAVSVITATLRTMTRLLAEFGCTPSSRSTIKTSGASSQTTKAQTAWGKALKITG
jgi:P27 family predicted phage terminase small subunit